MTIDQFQQKVHNGQRLTSSEALWCLTEAPLMQLGELATVARRRAVGDKAYYQCNLNINYTNICENECRLCAFYKDESDGYLLTPQIMADNVRRAHATGVNEVHIVGGLNRSLPLEYYLETLCLIKAIDPAIHIQGFTAVEIAFIAEVTGKSSQKVLEELHAAGLSSLPGGGAEIFAPRVRRELCEKKVPAEDWLRIHKEAHTIGMTTNATILYGHLEMPEEVVDHLLRLRQLQDESGGFQAFVPLAFFPKNTRIEQPTMQRDGMLDMRMIATSRLFLDNVPHVKSMWMIYGYKMCQVGLEFGADDIGGTYYDEEIVHAAGAATPKSLTQQEIETLLRRAGRTPVMVNSDYQPLAEVS